MTEEPNQDRDSENVEPEKPQKGQPTGGGDPDSAATGSGPSGGADPAPAGGDADSSATGAGGSGGAESGGTTRGGGAEGAGPSGGA